MKRGKGCFLTIFFFAIYFIKKKKGRFCVGVFTVIIMNFIKPKILIFLFFVEFLELFVNRSVAF
jgi:hypothetical protein